MHVFVAEHIEPRVLRNTRTDPPGAALPQTLEPSPLRSSLRPLAGSADQYSVLFGAGSNSVAPGGLVLTVYTSLSWPGACSEDKLALDSHQSSCLCLSSASIIGAHHHAWLGL